MASGDSIHKNRTAFGREEGQFFQSDERSKENSFSSSLTAEKQLDLQLEQGEKLTRKKRLEEAESTYSQVVKKYEELKSAYPEAIASLNYSNGLAIAYTRRAELLPEKAKKNYSQEEWNGAKGKQVFQAMDADLQKAEFVLNGILKSHPETAENRSELAKVYLTRATVYDRMENMRAAVADYQKAILLDSATEPAWKEYQKIMEQYAENLPKRREKFLAAHSEDPKRFAEVLPLIQNEWVVYQALQNENKAKEVEALLIDYLKKSAIETLKNPLIKKEETEKEALAQKVEEGKKAAEKWMKEGSLTLQQVLASEKLRKLLEKLIVRDIQGQQQLGWSTDFEKLSSAEKLKVLTELDRLGAIAHHQKIADEELSKHNPTNPNDRRHYAQYLYHSGKVALLQDRMAEAKLKLMELKEKTTDRPELLNLRNETRNLLQSLSLESVARLKQSAQELMSQRINHLTFAGKEFYVQEAYQLSKFLDGIETLIVNREEIDTIDEALAISAEQLSVESAQLHAEFWKNPIAKENWSIKLDEKHLSIKTEGGTVEIPKAELGSQKEFTVQVGKNGGAIRTAKESVVMAGGGGSGSYVEQKVYVFPPFDREQTIVVKGGIPQIPLGVQYQERRFEDKPLGEEIEGVASGRFEKGHPEVLDAVIEWKKGKIQDKHFAILFQAETREGLQELQSPTEERTKALELMKSLRGSGMTDRNGSYSLAAQIAESDKVFGKELSQELARLDPLEIREIVKEVEEERDQIANKVEARLKHEKETKPNSWKKQYPDGKGPGPREKEKMVAEAIQAEIAQRLRAKAFKTLDNLFANGWYKDPVAKEGWDIYRSMIDPTNDLFTISDAGRDAIVDEVVTTAVTAPIMVGTGMAVRAGLRGTSLAIRWAAEGGIKASRADKGIMLVGSALEGVASESATAHCFTGEAHLEGVGHMMLMSLAFHGGGKLAHAIGYSEEAIRGTKGLIRRSAKQGINFLGHNAISATVDVHANQAIDLAKEALGMLSDSSDNKTYLEKWSAAAARMVGFHYGNKAFALTRVGRALAEGEPIHQYRSKIAREHFLKNQAKDARRYSERARTEIRARIETNYNLDQAVAHAKNRELAIAKNGQVYDVKEHERAVEEAVDAALTEQVKRSKVVAEQQMTFRESPRPEFIAEDARAVALHLVREAIQQRISPEQLYVLAQRIREGKVQIIRGLEGRPRIEPVPLEIQKAFAAQRRLQNSFETAQARAVQARENLGRKQNAYAQAVEGEREAKRLFLEAEKKFELGRGDDLRQQIRAKEQELAKAEREFGNNINPLQNVELGMKWTEGISDRLVTTQTETDLSISDSNKKEVGITPTKIELQKTREEQSRLREAVTKAIQRVERAKLELQIEKLNVLSGPAKILDDAVTARQNAENASKQSAEEVALADTASESAWFAIGRESSDVTLGESNKTVVERGIASSHKDTSGENSQSFSEGEARGEQASFHPERKLNLRAVAQQFLSEEAGIFSLSGILNGIGERFKPQPPIQVSLLTVDQKSVFVRHPSDPHSFAIIVFENGNYLLKSVTEEGVSSAQPVSVKQKEPSRKKGTIKGGDLFTIGSQKYIFTLSEDVGLEIDSQIIGIRLIAGIKNDLSRSVVQAEEIGKDSWKVTFEINKKKLATTILSNDQAIKLGVVESNGKVNQGALLSLVYPDDLPEVRDANRYYLEFKKTNNLFLLRLPEIEWTTEHPRIESFGDGAAIASHKGLSDYYRTHCDDRVLLLKRPNGDVLKATIDGTGKNGEEAARITKWVITKAWLEDGKTLTEILQIANELLHIHNKENDLGIVTYSDGTLEDFRSAAVSNLTEVSGTPNKKGLYLVQTATVGDASAVATRPDPQKQFSNEANILHFTDRPGGAGDYARKRKQPYQVLQDGRIANLSELRRLRADLHNNELSEGLGIGTVNFDSASFSVYPHLTKFYVEKRTRIRSVTDGLSEVLSYSEMQRLDAYAEENHLTAEESAKLDLYEALTRQSFANQAHQARQAILVGSKQYAEEYKKFSGGKEPPIDWNFKNLYAVPEPGGVLLYERVGGHLFPTEIKWKMGDNLAVAIHIVGEKVRPNGSSSKSSISSPLMKSRGRAKMAQKVTAIAVGAIPYSAVVRTEKTKKGFGMTLQSAKGNELIKRRDQVEKKVLESSGVSHRLSSMQGMSLGFGLLGLGVAATTLWGLQRAHAQLRRFRFHLITPKVGMLVELSAKKGDHALFFSVNKGMAILELTNVGKKPLWLIRKGRPKGVRFERIDPTERQMVEAGYKVLIDKEGNEGTWTIEDHPFSLLDQKIILSEIHKTPDKRYLIVVPRNLQNFRKNDFFALLADGVVARFKKDIHTGIYFFISMTGNPLISLQRPGQSEEVFSFDDSTRFLPIPLFGNEKFALITEKGKRTSVAEVSSDKSFGFVPEVEFYSVGKFEGDEFTIQLSKVPYFHDMLGVEMLPLIKLIRSNGIVQVEQQTKIRVKTALLGSDKEWKEETSIPEGKGKIQLTIGKKEVVIYVTPDGEIRLYDSLHPQSLRLAVSSGKRSRKDPFRRNSHS